MTRMERRRRRRRILRIKLATTAAVLALTTASIVALTGGAAETVSEPTPQPPALQAEPVLLVAEHDSTYQPVQMTAEPAQEPEPVEEEDENEKIEAALLEQGYLHEEIPLDFDLQCHLITVCEEYGVPQSVALGVIQAESSFTATASNGSCYGYMQINSINSEWLSEKIGVTDLTDPYQNMLDEYDDEDLFPDEPAEGGQVSGDVGQSVFEQGQFADYAKGVDLKKATEDPSLLNREMLDKLSAKYAEGTSTEEHKKDPGGDGEAPTAAPAATKLPQDMSDEERQQSAANAPQNRAKASVQGVKGDGNTSTSEDTKACVWAGA